MPDTYRYADFLSDVESAKAAATAYYDSGALLMSDAEYDSLIDRIEQATKANPSWDSQGLVDQVAGGSSAGGEVVHPKQMGSLEKAKTQEDLLSFMHAVEGPVVVEPKLDGMAVRAEYKDGKLALLATRGDGRTGENVTANSPIVAGLPQRIKQTGLVEIRGEVYMSDSDFEVTNSKRIASGRKGFANSRNAVAGSLRNSDHGYDVRMSFAAYDADYPQAPGSYAKRMHLLRKWGVTIASDLGGTTSAEGEVAIQAVHELGNRRETLGFPIDGAVVKADLDTDRARLGEGTRSPRWAIAYKYAPNEATSVLRDIEVGVGRTGRISLRARIDSVEVGGTAITYATLHNPDFVQAQDLRIGQTVMVVRAGDVIPRVTSTVGEQDGNLPPWEPPAMCPQCGEKWDTTSVLWRCVTPECSTVGRITYAVSRDCLDIMGASEAICTALVDTGRVRDVADLLALSAGDLADLPLGETPNGKPRLLGPVVAEKLAEQIRDARKRPLSRILASLGVRTLGRTLSRRLAGSYPSLAAVREATAEELAQVDGIGTEKARIIAEELSDMADVLSRLELLLDTPQENTSTARALEGKTVVVTGAMTGPLAGLTRNQVNELIEAHGGKASGSVSAKTSLLVCADATSSKARKAQELSIPTQTPEEFARSLGVA